MTPPLATRIVERLRPDPARVVARLFVAGQEVVGGGGHSRTSGVVERILALDEAEVTTRLDELLERFDGRHRDLIGTFSQNADRVESRMDPDITLSEPRWLLLGATFTHEYSVEAAALCNPSIVVHPDQSDAPTGGVRFVMSVRGIGEGHRSSIGFRTGTLDARGEVTIDEAEPFCTTGSLHDGLFDRNAFQIRLRALGTDGESASYVLDHLGETFTNEELERRLAFLAAEADTRGDASVMAEQLRAIAACTYRRRFPAESDLSERVLWPATAAESHGLEDARFVRFEDDRNPGAGGDGPPTYHATYTAFDGTSIAGQLLTTHDFVTFTSSPLGGHAATNKGLALFPRRIGGRYAALSRYDGESNAISFSDSLGHWDDPVTVQSPHRDWELIQLGNCGSPIETDAGWLVLTHGVGPMRTYSIGALLLDIDDPTKVVATLVEPLLTPADDERDGYVPNVVYTCGALLHDDTLVIPYGIADAAIDIVTVSWSALRAAMVPVVENVDEQQATR